MTKEKNGRHERCPKESRPRAQWPRRPMPLRQVWHVRIQRPSTVAAAAGRRLGKRDFGRNAYVGLRRAPVGAILRRRRRRGRAMSAATKLDRIGPRDGRLKRRTESLSFYKLWQSLMRSIGRNARKSSNRS
jgi:hypothetical protein